jgi:hypothetical protein
MKILKWTVIIVSIFAVAWILINIDNYKKEWFDTFFQTDNYLFLIILVVGVWVVSELIKKLLIVEAKVLK